MLTFLHLSLGKYAGRENCWLKIILSSIPLNRILLVTGYFQFFAGLIA
ncbi:hypothetical protein Tph_c09890 [Thermacetogenium phaeum DSM 12270]|jgi:hypothetical protein|uniref:Uncharacterized protein n=1 Tax=Thermacetogenium phaeum (strain ATCC BAA-254 / DSM 26808 / PB) TaxID=1089553 RepID=K4LGL1_THEPS|nr:hypothetical protein Tph_c09890 [Thermacetogenium phaeum DSM 12270]